MISNSSCWLV